MYHYKRQENNKIAVVSSLYKGYAYDRYMNNIDKVIESHDSFAKHNGFDYLLYDDTINESSNLYRDNINLADLCLGINKWYVISHALETYEKVLFVDYDSVFIKNNIIDVSHDITLSPLNGSSYHDSVFLLLYLLYKEVPYKLLCDNTTANKFNSGFMLISRDFFTTAQVDEFVEYAYELYMSDDDNWLGMCDFDYSRIKDITKTTLTPFDEVFLMYLIISNNTCPTFFNTEEYNVYDANNITDITAHIHFCVDKEQFFNFFDIGVKGWKNEE